MPRIQSDPCDSFEVRSAVLGDGLVLNRTSVGDLVIHSVTDERPRELGCFDRITDAWKAVDAVDLAALDPRRCAA